MSKNGPIPPRAPAGLSASARRLWRHAVEHFAFDTAELALLESACRAWHRAEEARTMLESDGLVTTSDTGMQHPHPAVRIERDSQKEFRIAWCRLGLVDPSGADK